MPVTPSATSPTAQALGTLRIVIGALFLARTTPLLYVVPGLFRHHGGPLFGVPDATGLRAGLFGVVFPISVVWALLVLRTVSGVLFTLGVRARTAGLVTVACGYLVWSQEPLSFIFTFHGLLVTIALLALGDGANARALRPAVRARAPFAPRSSLWMLRAFVISIYAWSGVAKLGAAWVTGETLARLHAHGYATGALADFALSPAHVALTAKVTLGAELGLALMLLVRRARPTAVVLASLMHAGFELTVHPDVFGWLMVALLTLFWPLERAAARPRVHTSVEPSVHSHV